MEARFPTLVLCGRASSDEDVCTDAGLDEFRRWPATLGGRELPGEEVSGELEGVFTVRGTAGSEACLRGPC
jgi:hypothetical protein